MLFFIGNSQWFCIASKFPNAVSQLFFLFLYKRISTRHINHYRRHKPDVIAWLMHDKYFTQVTWTLLHPTPPHPHPSRKLHERYCTPPHHTLTLHASYMNVIAWLMHDKYFTQVTWTLLHPTPPHPNPSRKLHERYCMTHAWQVLHASYMNVITPHPTLTLHASYMNVIAPHPTPP